MSSILLKYANPIKMCGYSTIQHLPFPAIITGHAVHIIPCKHRMVCEGISCAACRIHRIPKGIHRYFYSSPKEIPNALAFSTMLSSGETYFNFPALSANAISVTSLSFNTTRRPYFSSLINYAAYAPNLEESTRSNASGLPPRCVCPGTATLTSQPQ